MTAGAEPFDRGAFQAELERAPDNREVGKDLLYENAHVKVWDITLAPGERTPFHCHAMPYFWVCVDAAPGYQRFADGTATARDYQRAQVVFDEPSEDAPLIHDLENRGTTTLRFVTVELKPPHLRGRPAAAP